MSDNETVEANALAQRVRRVEDMLEVYNLIATHPPYADTGAGDHTRLLWADDAVFARSDGQGSITIADMARMTAGAEMKAAHEAGLAHFSGHPYVRVDGDRAVAISYLQLVTPQPHGEELAIAGHGAGKGYRVQKMVANLWDCRRTPEGWRVHDRRAASLDGSAEARQLLMATFEGR